MYLERSLLRKYIFIRSRNGNRYNSICFVGARWWMKCVRHVYDGGQRADDIVINGFENHTICLSHLKPLHGVRSKQDQAGKASAVTVAHHILQGNVLHTDKTVTPVVRLVTTVDTVARSKDHQHLAEDPVKRCTTLNQMKNTNTIQSRSSTK